MESLDLAIQISDLLEAAEAEGGEVALLLDEQIIPHLSTDLKEADGVGLGQRFAKLLDQVRTTVGQIGGDPTRALKEMMKKVLGNYVQRTNDTLSARHIFHNAIMQGRDTMLTVTAAGLLANALAGQHPRQAMQMMQQIGARLSGEQPAAVAENCSAGAVGAGSIAVSVVGGKIAKTRKKGKESIFSEDVVPFHRPSAPESTVRRDSAWSDTHQLPPPIADLQKHFGGMIDRMTGNNVIQLGQPQAEPEAEPAAPELPDPIEALHQAGWKHVDTETYPSGQIMVFNTPTRFGSAHELYVYPDGYWKYGNTKGGPAALLDMIKQHAATMQNWEPAPSGPSPWTITSSKLEWTDLLDQSPLMETVKQIAEGIENRSIQGILVDPTTAELVLATHIALSPDRRRRFEMKPMSEMIRISHRLFEQGVIQIVMEEDG